MAKSFPMTLVHLDFIREVTDVHHLNMKKQDCMVLGRVCRPVVFSLREWRKACHDCKKKYL
jgi:hypothetical protein